MIFLAKDNTLYFNFSTKIANNFCAKKDVIELLKVIWQIKDTF